MLEMEQPTPAPAGARSKQRPALSLAATSLFQNADLSNSAARQPPPSARERYMQKRTRATAPVSPLAVKVPSSARPCGPLDLDDTCQANSVGSRGNEAASRVGISYASARESPLALRASSSDPPGQNTVVPPKLSATVESTTINDAGPLMQHVCAGGARLTLTLDRQVHYRAAPAATSAWTYHDFVTHEPNPLQRASRTGSISAEKGQDIKTCMPVRLLSVTRMLLCFTLDLEPYIHSDSSVSSENFEFVSVQIDFWTASSVVKPVYEDELATPVSAIFSDRSLSQNTVSSRAGTRSLAVPIVRGFFPGDVTESGFLQAFGPVLYKTIHQKTRDESTPVVLGSGQEKLEYQAFETKLAYTGKPISIDGDRFTGRGCQDATTSLQTPASSTFQFGSNRSYVSTPSPNGKDAASYGTSSIRIMVKRDTGHEGSWSSRKFPFLVLLEHPADAPSIEARIKLDSTTVKRAAPPGLARVNSLARASSTRSGLPSAPTLAPKRTTGHSATRSMSAVSSGVAVNARGVDEDTEHLVKIYPRQDPISVISCGSGTVKDTLYKSGTKVRPNTQKRQSAPVQARPTLAIAAAFGAMTPAAQYRESIMPQSRPFSSIQDNAMQHKPSVRSNQSTQSGSSAKHSRSASEQFTPAMYQRSGSLGSVSSRASTPSLASSSTSASVYSQPSAPRSFGSRRRTLHERSMSMSVRSEADCKGRYELESEEEEAIHSYRDIQPERPQQRPRINTMFTSKIDDDISEEMFDMVLTSWTDHKMDRQPTPTPEIAMGSIPYIKHMISDRSVIPFADRH